MKNTVTLNSIKKGYDAHTVLDGVSLVIDEDTAVMGPSGKGKTTLVRIIMGLERADSGDVSFYEKPKFSAVFQEDRLFEGFSAVENITAMIGRGKEREQLVTELLCELLIDPSELQTRISSCLTSPSRDLTKIPAIAQPRLSVNMPKVSLYFSSLTIPTRQSFSG